MYEYQSYSTGEFPDVLIYKNSITTLFEIKVSRSDFLNDSRKDSRKKYQICAKLRWIYGDTPFSKKEFDSNDWIVEKPHLGMNRYFVCPVDMIEVSELPENWGLIYFNCKKFKVQKKSGKHKRNIHEELSILCHAFRKYSGLDNTNVIVNKFTALKE